MLRIALCDEVIAHRLATIENADQILVLAGGGIAQRGTHRQLLQQQGVYKRLLDIRRHAGSREIA